MSSGRHRRGPHNIGSVQLIQPGTRYVGQAMHARVPGEQTGGGGAPSRRRAPFPPLNLRALAGFLARVVRGHNGRKSWHAVAPHLA